MTTDLSWILDKFHESTSGVRHAVLLSVDGLPKARDTSLDQDHADRLAAISSGMWGLAAGLDAHFDTGGRALTVNIDLPRAQLLVVTAGERAVLAVVAESEADPGIIGAAMTQLVDQLASHLGVGPREPGAPS
jgi:predicted regulator of Ras-like GTPase activity (Roadblock/LC7/MglB family)